MAVLMPTDNTYFRVFRSIWRSNDFTGLQSGDARVVMFALLSEVAWSERSYTCNVCGKTATVARGDIWFSMIDLAGKAQTTRDVVRTTLKRLVRSRFISRSVWCKHRLLYRLVNVAKFDDLIGDLHGPSTDPPRTLHGPSTREKKNKKNKKDQETTGGKSASLFPETTTRRGAILDPHIRTADALRALLLPLGGGEGWKQTSTYKKKRKLWAEALHGLASRNKNATPENQVAIVKWVVEEAEPFEIDGEQWTWAKVLCCTNPAAKLAEKFGKLWDARRRAANKVKREQKTDYHFSCDTELMDRISRWKRGEDAGDYKAPELTPEQFAEYERKRKPGDVF